MNYYEEIKEELINNEINYYISIANHNNLSYRKFRERIKSNEYKRLPQTTKDKLIVNKETYLIDNVKNPIIIKNNKNKIVTHKVLQKLILEDIEDFLEELGNGFTFIKLLLKVNTLLN